MKSPSDALADLLATPEGLRTARLLQGNGLLGSPAPMAPRPMPRPPEPISIWEPREADGETVWIRPDPQPLGDHFAATKVLRRKAAELPLRVGFFGESVAAGYLYAPHVTPARVLEDQLQAIGGSGNFAEGHGPPGVEQVFGPGGTGVTMPVPLSHNTGPMVMKEPAGHAVLLPPPR